MDQVDSNSDKITIKVRHWDEDYHDITIDWSNESFDYRKQVFHQLSAFTGIPVKYQVRVGVTNVGISVNLGNPEFGDEEGRGHLFPDEKEEAMEQIQDGACYLLETDIFTCYPTYPSIFCSYHLAHRDLVNENGCNLYYCHSLGSRFFTKKFSKLIKSEHLQTLLDPRVAGQARETLTRIKLNLNIEHITRLECNRYFESLGHFDYPFSNYYLRYRG
ncbi:uncharacterized protein LOC107368055 [Tetranychus urticae]|uniref:Uncharacterized protein n=1 Tax=Tetranychus urticae TaxID=32264 RepID=T1KX22_TETUR|nr:uncharacterized protein LOC107368055 [Tetranychus urticae]